MELINNQLRAVNMEVRRQLIPLPFIKEIGGGLKPGTEIQVVGKIDQNKTSGFSLKLSCGEKSGDDVPLYIKTEPWNKRIFFKSRNDGWWVGKEDKGYLDNFMRINLEFRMTVMCETDMYKISVDNEAFYEYSNGLPCYLTRFFFIEGELDLLSVTFNGVGETGNPETVLPVTRSLNWKNEDKTVVIKGIPLRANPWKMEINFEAEKGDILFQLSTYFYKEIVTRNTRIDMKWGRDEKHLALPFPFSYGVPFELGFTLQSKCIYVDLNGVHLCKYTEREHQFNLIKKIEVSGSVIIIRANVCPKEGTLVSV